MFDRQRHLLSVLGRRWLINFLLGLVAALICLQLAHAEASAGAVERQSIDKLLYAAAYGAALVCWTFAFVGAGVRYLSRPSAIVRYVADASYWMYVAHLPIVMALQTALMLSPWHWALKYFLVIAFSSVILLLTYHYGVRTTWIGLMLNGKKHPKRSDNVNMILQ